MTTDPGGKFEQTIEDATVALINSDPELRDELRGLISDATKRYRHTIRWGAPDARLSAIKAIVPGLLRAMGRVEQSESDKAMHEAYERLLPGGPPALSAPAAAAVLPAPIATPTAVLDAPPSSAAKPTRRQPRPAQQPN